MIDAVNIKIDGKEYTDFISATITKSLEELCGEFNIVCSSTPNIDFPIKVGSKCDIVIHGENVINGYIEKLSISYSSETESGTHKITVSGRDRTADLVDSTIGGSESSEFQVPKNGITLKQITEKVLSQFNLSDIKVIDNLNLKPFTDLVSDKFGSKAFDFLEKYAKKRQVLITTTGDGNIEFVRSPAKSYKTALILSKNAPATIISGNVVLDDSKRFNQYFGSAQGNPTSLQNLTSKPLNIAGSGNSPVVDNEIRNSRIYHFEPHFSSEQETLTQRVQWEANYRKSQSRKLKYTVQGHVAKDDKEIWKIGRLVSVTDEFADILNGVKLISNIRYTFDLTNGARTDLTLLDKDAFSLIVNKPDTEVENERGDLGQYVSSGLTKARQEIGKALRGVTGGTT